MSEYIENIATVKYNSGGGPVTVVSNHTSVKVESPISIEQASYEASYTLKSTLLYMIIVKNLSDHGLHDVVLKDDLATYTVSNDVKKYTPLTYIGPARQYLNGELLGDITPVISASGDSIEFHIPNPIPPKAKFAVLYKVRTNEYTDIGGLISHAAYKSSGSEEIKAEAYELPMEDYADIRIKKEMYPDPVTDGTSLNYLFTIENYGVSSANDVVLTDHFSKAPKYVDVWVGKNKLNPGDFSYTGGVFTYPREGSGVKFSIPAASVVQDNETGVIAVTPSKEKVRILGKL